MLLPTSGGRATRMIAANILATIPLIPFPNMTAPMYLGGSMAAHPKTVDCTKPLTTPKQSIKQMQRAYPAEGAKKFAQIGRSKISTAIAKNPPVILN